MTGLFVLGLIGAGVGAYSAYESGQSQKAIANYNAQNNERNMKMQMMGVQAQSAIQKQQAEAEYAMRSAESQARMNNAISMENKVTSQDMVNRENLRKRTEMFAREQGSQRAAIAASGVVESSGTPLDLLAETAATIQRDREEQSYGNEIERRTLLREADMERLGGQLALAGATLNRNAGLAQASLTLASGRMANMAGMRESQIMRLSGAAAGRAGTMSAAGTLLSGVASAGGNYMRMGDARPRSFGLS